MASKSRATSSLHFQPECVLPQRQVAFLVFVTARRQSCFAHAPGGQTAPIPIWSTRVISQSIIPMFHFSCFEPAAGSVHAF